MTIAPPAAEAAPRAEEYAVVGEDGAVRFHSNLCGHDAALAKRLAALQALNGAPRGRPPPAGARRQ